MEIDNYEKKTLEAKEHLGQLLAGIVRFDIEAEEELETIEMVEWKPLE